MRTSFYYIYIILIIILNLLSFAVPYIAKSTPQLSSQFYSGFSLICHQLTARSLCLYDSGIGDCFPQNGQFSESKETIVVAERGTGYKFPVDARDMAIYATMLVGGLALPFIIDKNSKCIPNLLFLITASIPAGVDGFTQLIGLRESTNLIRVITGVILGLVIPFFLVPTANVLLDPTRHR